MPAATPPPERVDVLRDVAPQFAKFAAVGVAGVVINLAVFTALGAAGVPYLAAGAAAFVAAVANNFVLNARWTFADSHVSLHRSAACFTAVSTGGLLVSLLVLHAAVAAGAPPVAGQLLGIAIVTPLNYAGNRLWSFRERAVAAPTERGRALRAIVIAWAGSRALVLAAVAVVQELGWPRPGWYASHGRAFSLLQAWDGRWYRIVAERGYLSVPHHQSDTAFFPLFPSLMNVLRPLGISTWTSGLVLANVGLLAALVAVYELVRTWLPEQDARRAAVYAALFPVGYVFSMAYPESLMLAAVAGAGAAAARGRWTLAALLAATAAVGRPEGVFVALPLLALAVSSGAIRSRSERGGALAAVAAAPAALAAVAAYQRAVVGDAAAFSHAQVEWGRRFELGGVERAFAELAHASGNNLWLWRDAAFCAIYVVLLVVAARGAVPWPWVASSALIVLLPLETGSFTSDARFGLLAPPVYAALARLGRARLADVLLRSSMALLLVGASATILLRWP